MGQYSEARAQFEAALRLNPDLPAAQSGLADTLALQGMTARAIPHYERALAIDPAMGSAQLGLGSALASQGRIPEAMRHLQGAAHSRDPAVRQAAQSALQAIDRQLKRF
jgi:tetratricopeptide (TPR) repeat protein